MFKYKIFEILCCDIKFCCLLKLFIGGWYILNKVDIYLKRVIDIVYKIRY